MQRTIEAKARVISEQEQNFSDEHLRARVVSLMEQNGISLNLMAEKLSRSASALSQWLNGTYKGNNPGIERDLRNVLRREEDLRFVDKPEDFCPTSIALKIWEIAQFCNNQQKMGAVIGPAGSGKTICLNEYVRQHPGVTFITMDITKRSLGALLGMIAFKNAGIPRGATNAEILETIVTRFKEMKGFLIVDEAHFCSWESFECLRSLYDQARVGILVCGMPRLFSEMRRRNSFLWDQITSRFAVKMSVSKVEKRDVELIAGAIQPNLSRNCLDFLHEISLGGGRFRVMCELLRRAVYVSEMEHVSIDISLLKELSSLVVF